MEYRSVTKIHQGNFITRYDIEYMTETGLRKDYEMISRDPGIDSFEGLRRKKTDAVVMVIHDESGERILLNREYRMATGEWVYNFPAGLIDEGEEIRTAAVRELREETGLHIDSIDDVWKESYSAVGFSNEMCAVIVGTASGEFCQSSSEMEEIEAGWFTKAQVRDLLGKEFFAARTQAYCKLWSKG